MADWKPIEMEAKIDGIELSVHRNRLAYLLGRLKGQTTGEWEWSVSRKREIFKKSSMDPVSIKGEADSIEEAQKMAELAAGRFNGDHLKVVEDD